MFHELGKNSCIHLQGVTAQVLSMEIAFEASWLYTLPNNYFYFNLTSARYLLNVGAEDWAFNLILSIFCCRRRMSFFAAHLMIAIVAKMVPPHE